MGGTDDQLPGRVDLAVRLSWADLERIVNAPDAAVAALEKPRNVIATAG